MEQEKDQTTHAGKTKTIKMRPIDVLVVELSVFVYDLDLWMRPRKLMSEEHIFGHLGMQQKSIKQESATKGQIL